MTTRSKIFVAALAASMLATPTMVVAQDYGRDRGDRYDHDRGDRYDRDRYDRDRGDHREGYRDGYREGRYDRGYHRGYRHARWRRGERLGAYHRYYAPVDYRAYRLRAPPRGYHYVRDDRGDIILAAIATGLIISVIANSN